MYSVLTPAPSLLQAGKFSRAVQIMQCDTTARNLQPQLPVFTNFKQFLACYIVTLASHCDTTLPCKWDSDSRDPYSAWKQYPSGRARTATVYSMIFPFSQSRYLGMFSTLPTERLSPHLRICLITVSRPARSFLPCVFAAPCSRVLISHSHTHSNSKYQAFSSLSQRLS